MRPLSCAVARTSASEHNPSDITNNSKYLFRIPFLDSCFFVRKPLNVPERRSLLEVKLPVLPEIRRQFPASRVVGPTSLQDRSQKSSKPYGESVGEPGDSASPANSPFRLP